MSAKAGVCTFFVFFTIYVIKDAVPWPVQMIGEKAIRTNHVAILPYAKTPTAIRKIQRRKKLSKKIEFFNVIPARC